MEAGEPKITTIYGSSRGDKDNNEIESRSRAGDISTFKSNRTSLAASMLVDKSDAQAHMTLEERKEHFSSIYKLLRVKKKGELRMNKKTRQELKKKFFKHSK